MADRNKQVRQYADARVHPDSAENKIQREMVTGVVDHIHKSIPNAGDIQYTGSNYEGNATKHSSDFDVMIDVAPKGSQFQAERTGEADVRKLKYQNGADPNYVEKYVTDEGYLSGQAVVRQQVQPAIDRSIGIQNHGGHVNVNGREVEVDESVKGAAITLDLKSGEHETQVDVVPSVNSQHVIGGREGVDYVAKPSSKTAEGGAWRESYSREEKETFKGIDQGNQVHREVLKTAKTVAAGDPDLGDMRSFIAKTAELNLIEKDRQRVSQGADPKSWTKADEADRLQDLGKEISRGQKKGHMTHPSNRAANILEGVSDADREKWRAAIGPDGKGLVEKANLGNK